jgi:riboflavin kinase/FMN adenylyltransferase
LQQQAYSVRLLTSIEEKKQLVKALGVNKFITIPFGKEFSRNTTREFLKNYLKEKYGVSTLIIGYDHRFGKPCEGECFDCYAAYGKELGIDVVKLSSFTMDGVAVSSSVVRRALVMGDVEKAYRVLGHRYAFEGTVVHGAGFGRELGFPTANILPVEEMMLLPADGVYEVDACVEGLCYKGVMNIGVKPTVAGGALRTIEVHLIDFSADIYGKRIVIEIIRRLRDEQRFENFEALRSQIEYDVARVMKGI